MRWPSASLVLALLLPLAGCITPGTVDDTVTAPPPLPSTETVWGAVNGALAGLPCQAQVPASTTASSENLRLLSALALPEEKDGIHAELDIRGDLVVHARYDSGGFEVYDIHDPLHIQHLGNFTEASGGLDVKFSPDNRTVLVGTGSGIVLADISDPDNVVKAGEWKFSDVAGFPTGPSGGASQNAHMIYTARIAGADWAFLAPNSNTGIWVLKIEGTPEARRLTYVAQTLPVEGGPLGPHDLYVQKDAQDGHWYLYSSDGFHGWTVFNVDDPAKPMLAGGWTNPAEGGYTHTIQAATLNGKRIVATIAEVGANFLRVYDASNLRAPVLLGQYQAKTEGASATHPQHNFNIVDGNLFLSYYSFGMYVFNLTEFTKGPSLPLAGTLTLKPAAHWAVGVEPSDGPLAFNGYWDTVVKDGVVYVSWIEGGLVALGFGCHGADLPDPLLTSNG
ncbi:MAG TPA: hypothetical protein VM286_03370 [Candidatus Thermoplasmatota archaeon]|nr:hypothetical protein [Candidatus Thermoplasmatota archaeon]